MEERDNYHVELKKDVVGTTVGRRFGDTMYSSANLMSC